MLYTRRDVGRIALAAGFAAGFGSKLKAAAKPDSKIKGVQIGTITYSFRSMPDQSAEATLQYTVDSGISAIELMGGPVNDWTKKKGNWDSSPAAAAAAGKPGSRGRTIPRRQEPSAQRGAATRRAAPGNIASHRRPGRRARRVS